MALSAVVESLENVPEELQDYYEEAEDGWRLKIEGVKTEEEIQGLKSALDTERSTRRKLEKMAKQFEGVDLEEYRTLKERERELEDQRAKEEGRWDELRDRLKGEYEQQIAELKQKLDEERTAAERTTVDGALRAAIAEAGIKPEYQRAAYLLLKERGPQVIREDGKLVGVFPDELHGDKPITEYVKAWADSEEAAPFMPAPPASGGGAKGGGGAPPQKKARGEMDRSEKVAFIKEHGEEAYFALPM